MPMRKVVVVTALVLGVFLGTGLGQVMPVPQRDAGSRDFSISGRIMFGTTNSPNDRIEVQLMGIGGQVVASAYSDGGNNFEFRNLLPGSYIIHISYSGFEEVREPVEVRNFLGSRTISISILMNRSVELRRLDGPDGLPTDDQDVVDITEMQRDYPKKAIEEYRRAVEDSRKGDTEKAMKRLLDALKIAPDFYHAHNNLGLLYQKRGQYREAEQEYETARRLSPTSQAPLVNLGSLYIQESDARQSEGRRVVGRLLDDALDILEEAIRMRPLAPMAHYYLGAANYKSSFYEEAEAALKRAHELDPRLGITRLMLANVYMKQQRWDDVLDQLESYLKDNPKASDRAAITQMRDTILKGLESVQK
jgi:tetratricopeptide (TPR) repeat protein